MNLKNGTALLVVGALAFAARKRGRPSLFSRLTKSQPSSADSLDPDSGEEVEREVRTLLAQGIVKIDFIPICEPFGLFFWQSGPHGEIGFW